MRRGLGHPLAQNLFPGGSFGNGGAMRAAPWGLFFHDDLDRVWAEAGRRAAVTHRHPLGVERAQVRDGRGTGRSG